MGKEKLKVGDYVELQSRDAGYLCPICGYEHSEETFGVGLDACDNCWSTFKQLNTVVQIEQIKEKGHDTFNKLELKDNTR